MLSVGGEPSGRVRETVTRQIQAAETVVAGQPSLLQLKLPGAKLEMHFVFCFLFIRLFFPRSSWSRPGSPLGMLE